MKFINRSPYKNNKHITQFLEKLLTLKNDLFIIKYRNDIMSPVYFSYSDDGEEAIYRLEEYIQKYPGSDMSLELDIIGPNTWVQEKHQFLGTLGFNIETRRSIVEKPIQCFINEPQNIITNYEIIPHDYDLDDKKVLHIVIRSDKLQQFGDEIINLFNL
jgi:hypothetical protein